MSDAPTKPKSAGITSITAPASRPSDPEPPREQLHLPEIPAGATFEMVTVSEERHRGPWPHPELMARYAEIDPSLAAKIVQAADEERALRHELARADSAREDRFFDARAAERKRGQVFGLIFTIASMVAASYCASINQPWVAAAFVGGGFASVAYAFVLGQRPRGGASSKQGSAND